MISVSGRGHITKTNLLQRFIAIVKFRALCSVFWFLETFINIIFIYCPAIFITFFFIMQLDNMQQSVILPIADFVLFNLIFLFNFVDYSNLSSF